jgi:cytosine/adenosine deaminase-related metal-dependent hydrolase
VASSGRSTVRRLLLQARQVLATALEPPFEGGLLVLEGRVALVLRSMGALRRCARAEGLAARDQGEVLLAPGLVDAHAHLELGPLAGQAGGEAGFAAWIAELLALRSRLTPADFEAGVSSGARELLARGATTVGDVSSTGAAERVLPSSPIRSVLLREVLDAADPARSPAALARVRRALPRRRRSLEGLAPHAPYTLSLPLLRQLGALARRRRIAVQVHWAESPEEELWLCRGEGPFAELLRNSPACSGLELLARAGLLEGRDPAVALSLVHGNHPGPGEIERVARAGAALVHCPGTHAFFRREPFDPLPWLEAGVPLALGTDSLASNEALDPGREMALLRRAVPGLPPEQVLDCATRAGARALGLTGQVGEAMPGAWADLVAWSLPAGAPPLEALTSGEGRPQSVWVGGRRIGSS